MSATCSAGGTNPAYPTFSAASEAGSGNDNGIAKTRPKGPLYPSQRSAMFENVASDGRWPCSAFWRTAKANSEQRIAKSDNNPVREKVLQSIREQKLMRAGDRVAVAVSGGADSVALLRVLLELREELGIVLAVAHFNHGLRGAESDADQAFVAELARQSGLEFFAGLWGCARSRGAQ